MGDVMQKRFSVSRGVTLFVIANNAQNAMRLVRQYLPSTNQEDSWFSVGVEPSPEGGVGTLVYRVTVNFVGSQFGNRCSLEDFNYVSRRLEDYVRGAVYGLNKSEIPEMGLNQQEFSVLSRACFSLNRQALDVGDGNASTDEEVENIACKNGWSDKKFIALLIQYIRSMDGGYEGIAKYLSKIALEENRESEHD